jgi:hypothetical protein
MGMVFAIIVLCGVDRAGRQPGGRCRAMVIREDLSWKIGAWLRA